MDAWRNPGQREKHVRKHDEIVKKTEIENHPPLSSKSRSGNVVLVVFCENNKQGNVEKNYRFDKYSLGRLRQENDLQSRP
jgi:hypothetical protein